LARIELIGGPLDGQTLEAFNIPMSYCIDHDGKAVHWSLVRRDMIADKQGYMLRLNLDETEYDKLLSVFEEAWADLKKRFDEPKSS